MVFSMDFVLHEFHVPSQVGTELIVGQEDCGSVVQPLKIFEGGIRACTTGLVVYELVIQQQKFWWDIFRSNCCAIFAFIFYSSSPRQRCIFWWRHIPGEGCKSFVILLWYQWPLFFAAVLLQVLSIPFHFLGRVKAYDFIPDVVMVLLGKLIL